MTCLFQQTKASCFGNLLIDEREWQSVRVREVSIFIERPLVKSNLCPGWERGSGVRSKVSRRWEVAAACCWVRRSVRSPAVFLVHTHSNSSVPAASARCMRLLFSGLSGRLRQPTQRHRPEQGILACAMDISPYKVCDYMSTHTS